MARPILRTQAAGRNRAAELYQEHRPALRRAAARAARRYRVPFSDMAAEADYLFVLAARRYDGERPFGGLLHTYLRRLADAARAEARRNLILRRAAADLEQFVAPPDPADRADALSADARAVMGLALASRPGLTPRQIRVALKKYLAASGWGGPRVRAAFLEIKGAFA
jgi:DNA-directed RNA polymerase specialized sigma24 family protein